MGRLKKFLENVFSKRIIHKKKQKKGQKLTKMYQILKHAKS
jgi:hypothetical protein